MEMTAKERLLKSIESNLGPEVLSALSDEAVIEIMLNPDGSLWIERFREGMFHRGSIAPQKVDIAIRFIASALKVEVSDERPSIKGELPTDDSRFQGMLPPIVESPSFTIRKKPWRVFTMEEYVAEGNLSAEARAILEEAIFNHKNIVVAGGTGTGKTTFGNALIEAIARITPDDRLVIIEDTRELQPQSKNVFRMKASDTVMMNDLLVDAMRLRPDRILVGEVRDASAQTMINAWNTGHEGGIATLHSNSALETMSRIEDMISLGFKRPDNSYSQCFPVPRSIGMAIDYVVFMKKAPGVRRVTEIVEVGYTDRYVLKHIYQYKAISAKPFSFASPAV
jgi:type IV secretion system protein VirB11